MGYVVVFLNLNRDVLVYHFRWKQKSIQTECRDLPWFVKSSARLENVSMKVLYLDVLLSYHLLHTGLIRSVDFLFFQMTLIILTRSSA